MKIIVLGAGIIGVSTAWYLQAAGHEVIVIDRQSGAAQETSFANGGQISVSHAEPWANPSAPLKIFKYLRQADAPLLFKPRAEIEQWRWALQFLRECTPSRTLFNLQQIYALAEYSRACLQDLKASTNISFENATKGILHFYTSQKEYEHAANTAQFMRDLGCDRQNVTRSQILALEPALKTISAQIVGGDFTATDESGNAQLFCKIWRNARKKLAFSFYTIRQ